MRGYYLCHQHEKKECREASIFSAGGSSRPHCEKISAGSRFFGVSLLISQIDNTGCCTLPWVFVCYHKIFLSSSVWSEAEGPVDRGKF